MCIRDRSYSDRQEMEKLYLQGWHMNDIAAKLGVSLATVYHELSLIHI